MPPDDLLGPQIHLHRALARAAQGQPDQLSQAMGASANFLRTDPASDGDIAQRIEKLDRELQLLGEELPHIRERRAAAAKENALGLRAALLGTVKADRTGDLRVETGHRVANHFRNARHIGILRLRVGPAEAHEAVAFFPLFRHAERLAKILGNGLGDGTAAVRDAAAENLVRLDENQIRAPRTDIDDQGTAADVAIVIAESVIDGHRGDIDDGGLEARRLDRVIDIVEQVGLDGDNDDFHLSGIATVHELVVPDHFIDRIRDVLLRLEGHDLIDLLFTDRRKLDEPGKNGLRSFKDCTSSFRSRLA